MNMFKKGPEIKLPKLKVPDALLDLYYDLRARHLLPLAAVLVVAIIAVPIVLTQSSGSGSSGTTAIPTPSDETSRTSELVVAKAAPGLRAYRRRLNHLHAKDPFKQQYANPESATEGTATASTTGGGESGVSTPASETPATSTSQTESESTTVTTHHLVYFSYAIDVRIVSEGTHQEGEATGKSKPQVHDNLPELTKLPSRKTPAAIFLGVSKDGNKALLLLSSNVEATVGDDGICVLGSKTCQLLALAPGGPETFVYGPQGRTFRIQLLKIHSIASKKPHRAPLGNKPKPSNRSAHKLGARPELPISQGMDVGADSSP
jgi:hypothetical protein